MGGGKKLISPYLRANRARYVSAKMDRKLFSAQFKEETGNRSCSGDLRNWDPNRSASPLLVLFYQFQSSHRLIISGIQHPVATNRAVQSWLKASEKRTKKGHLCTGTLASRQKWYKFILATQINFAISIQKNIFFKIFYCCYCWIPRCQLRWIMMTRTCSNGVIIYLSKLIKHQNENE